MLRFDRMEGPFGIPVFYQQLPDAVGSSGIALTVFTGSADDLSVGLPGVYHWLEHCPFRGTHSFPGGYSATKGPVTRVGGAVGAWTNHFCTNYHATLPTRHLATGLDVVVDLVARPILSDEAILAEREIVYQEIRDKLADSDGYVAHNLGHILFGDHPLANPVLGSPESLDAMNPDHVRRARANGYDRSRMAFFVSSALHYDAVLEMISGRFGLLPSGGVSQRQNQASFGSVPWNEGKKTEIRYGFPSATVKVLFEEHFTHDIRTRARRALLRDLFSHGGSGSPLYRVVRENNPLAYTSSLVGLMTRDGGYWGFHVATSPNHVSTVESALGTLFDDPQVRSKSRFEEIQEANRCFLDMRIISPKSMAGSAVEQVRLFGAVTSVEEFVEVCDTVTHEEVVALLDEFCFDKARVVIASGG